MFYTLSQVALGGAIGSVLRFLCISSLSAPWATVLVNVAGCFVMGICFVSLSRSNLPPFLMTGVLGGFTTFSAFSLDVLILWQSGQIPKAAIYTAASVTLSLIAVALGAALARGALA